MNIIGGAYVNTKLKKIVKLTPLIFFAAAVSAVLFPMLIENIPKGKNYFYSNGEIMKYSWQQPFMVFLYILMAAALIWILALTVISAIYMIRSKEKLGVTILLSWVTGIVCLICMLLCGLSINSSEDSYVTHNCYEFTDGRHTIVIEEKSFLLSGRGTIYQLHDDNSATIIGGFSTDDGGLNCGNYEIEWYDTSAKITYRTFSTKTSKGAEIVQFE